MTDISDLTAAISRAEGSGVTDEEQELLGFVKIMLKEIEPILSKNHKDNGGKLETNLILRALAIQLGMYIQANRSGGPLSGAVLAAEYLQLVFQVASGN